MPHLDDKDMQKEIIKEAISEWLDKQFSALGRWTFAGLTSAGLAAMAYFVLTTNGWHK